MDKVKTVERVCRGCLCITPRAASVSWGAAPLHFWSTSLHFTLFTSASLCWMCFSLEQFPLPSCTPRGCRTLVKLFLYFRNSKSRSQQCLSRPSFICPISCNRSGQNSVEPVSSGPLETAAGPHSGTDRSFRAGHWQISGKFQSMKVGTNQRCFCPLTRKKNKINS